MIYERPMIAIIANQTVFSVTDMLWILISAGLVFLMQPGFMCLESGLTRSKNSINVAVKNLADFGISVALFWAIGYGFMFGQTGGGWLGFDSFFLSIDQQPTLIAFFVFQAMFCSTATTIVSGAVAERLRFGAYLAIAVLVSGLIYPLLGHWVWNGLEQGTSQGWLGQLGFIDFAGSTVVHSTGAWVSLAVLVIIGAREGRFPDHGPPQKIQGSNLPMAVLGVMLGMAAVAPGCAYYSFTGASIPAHLNTIAIPIVEDNSASPVGTLDEQLTQLLNERFVGQTRLVLETVEQDADALLTASIDRYTNTPAAVSGQERAALSRITISVSARYLDQTNEDELVSRTFSNSQEYDPQTEGLEGELTAAATALRNIADDIFTAATSDW